LTYGNFCVIVRCGIKNHRLFDNVNKEKKMLLRKIVTDAFKCDQLVYQFTRVDVEDSFLKHGTEEEVNEKYTDSYIIKEAEHHLYMSKEWLEDDLEGEDLKMHTREYNQLKRFLAKHKK